MTDVLMPALSPTMEEGTLAKWFIKPGDTVRSGDVIAEIETDKATMEVEAVDEGEVAEILVPEGTEEVKVNTPIARLKGDAEAAGAAPLPSSTDPAGRKEPLPPRGEGVGSRTNSAGHMKSPGDSANRRRPNRKRSEHPSSV